MTIFLVSTLSSNWRMYDIELTYYSRGAHYNTIIMPDMGTTDLPHHYRP